MILLCIDPYSPIQPHSPWFSGRNWPILLTILPTYSCHSLPERSPRGRAEHSLVSPFSGRTEQPTCHGQDMGLCACCKHHRQFLGCL